MGHLKPIQATTDREESIIKRRKSTETPKRLETKRTWKTIDGIVSLVHPNGTYDVLVPGRSHPWTELHCIIPNVELHVDQGCAVAFCLNEPNLAMIIAAKFVGKHKFADIVQIGLGEWMQSEGNIFLSQPGATNIFPDPVSGGAGQIVISLGLSTEQEFGMANLLGIVAGSGTDSDNESTGVGTLFFVALMVPSVGNAATVTMQVQAYEMVPSYSLKWTLYFAHVAANPVERRMRANLFWDKDARVLTVADRKIWSILVPTSGTPTSYAESAIEARYCFSAAGKYGLACLRDGQQVQAYQRGANLVWTAQGVPYNLADLGTVIQWLDTANTYSDASRPWPAGRDGRFRILWPGASQDTLVTVATSGSVSNVQIGPAYPSTPEVVLETALAAGDDWIENVLLGSSMPVFYPISGTRVDYGGRLAWGDVPWSDYNWEYDNSALQSPFHQPTGNVWTVDTQEGSPAANGLLCPRGNSNPGSATITAAQWADGSGSTMQPCLQQDSTGALVYAKICGVRASVPNHRPMAGNFVTTGGVPPALSYIAAMYHWPQQRWLAETRLCKTTTTGALYTLGLSNSFAGLTYDDGNFAGGTFPVTLSETLAVPENVWEIKLGSRAVSGEEGTQWTDAIFLLQDWREAANVAPRLRFRAISPALTILDSVDGLSPVDTITGSPTSQVDTFNLDGSESFVTLSRSTVNSITSVTLNGSPLTDTVDFSWAAGQDVEIYASISAADVLVVTYSFTDSSLDGQYEWAQTDCRMFVNLGTLYQWALVAVYSESQLTSVARVDLHLLNLADLSNVTVDLTLTETGTPHSLPRPDDFDRFAATASGIWWIQRDPADSLHKFWSLLHT